MKNLKRFNFFLKSKKKKKNETEHINEVCCSASAAWNFDLFCYFMQTTQDALWASIHSGGTHSDYLNRAYSPVSFPFTHLHKENMTSFLKEYKSRLP